MRYYLADNQEGTIGVTGSMAEAMDHINRPGVVAFWQDFTEVSQEEYDNTVIDLRFEDGEWVQ